jgi:Protein of unknown function (DUF2851)
MRENFLHFLWRTRRFDATDLRTTDGHTVEIIRPGEHNTHAGPDFFNARLRIGDVEWAGNVEMHVRASEWATHGHADDRAYDNVVLHVVWQADAPALRADGSPLPCLVLRGRTAEYLLATYADLEAQQAWIPCAGRWAEVADIVRLNWYDRLLVERLEQKTTRLATQLEATGGHWEEAFYRLLARSFGLRINAEPFEALARSLPLQVLTKHKNNRTQIEALLFGQAGWLDEEWADAYPQELAREYRFLRHKYGLERYVQRADWKFLRLRPANFPTVRLAQFAALVYASVHLFSKILEATSVRSLEHLFEPEVSAYWLTHYQFDKISPQRPKHLGRDFVHLLLINTVVPSVFYYGQARQLPDYQDKALCWLEDLPPESNAVLDGWATLGVVPRHAYQTQALLHLKSQYCDARRCVECAVGGTLLR